MAIKLRNILKGIFVLGAKPTQQDFADVFDSYIHQNDTLPSAGILAGITTATEAGLRAAFRTASNTFSGKTIIVDKDSPYATDIRVGIGVYNTSIPFSTINAAVTVAASYDVVIVNRSALPYNETVLLNTTKTVYIRLNEGVVVDGLANAAFKADGPGQGQLAISMASYTTIQNTGTNEPAVYVAAGNCGILIRGIDGASDGLLSSSSDIYGYLPTIVSTNNSAVHGLSAGGYHGSAITGVLLRSMNGPNAVYQCSNPITNCVIVSDNGAAIAGSFPYLKGCNVVSKLHCVDNPGAIGIRAKNCRFYSSDGMGIYMTNNNTAAGCDLINCTINSKDLAIWIQANPTYAVRFTVVGCALTTRDPAVTTCAFFQDTGGFSAGLAIAANLLINKPITGPSYMQTSNNFQFTDTSGQFPSL